jgi:hypothetical protein
MYTYPPLQETYLAMIVARITRAATSNCDYPRNVLQYCCSRHRDWGRVRERETRRQEGGIGCTVRQLQKIVSIELGKARLNATVGTSALQSQKLLLLSVFIAGTLKHRIKLCSNK